MGIENQALTSEELKVYPNPNDGSFTVRILNSTKYNSVELVDMLGKVISAYKLNGSDTSEIEINEELESGIYFVRLRGSDILQSQKIIVY